MEIKDLQNQAEEIVNKAYEKEGSMKDSDTIFMHLIEEIGEVSRQLVNPKLKRDNTDISNLKDELADVVLLTSKLAITAL